MHNSNLLYLISGEYHDLINCYYCESCNKLISQEEVKIEIDTYFCPSCLENIPSSEAFSRNFRCVNCHDCPKCMATISTNKLDLGIETNENSGRIMQYSYNCGYCHFSLDVNHGMNIGSETNEKTIKESNDGSQKLFVNKQNDTFSLQESNYLSLITDKVKNSAIKHFDPNITSGMTQLKSINDEQSELHPALRILEEKHEVSTSLLKKKNIWLNFDEMKCFSNIRNSLPTCQKKNNLSYKQYLNNPDIINSVYLSLRTNSNNQTKLYPYMKKLSVQISKRCMECKRLVIKPQLNPLSQPPFRVNLSANLFLPNFRIVSIKNNSSNNRSFTKIVRIRIENLMDRQVRVDFLSEKDQNEQLSIGNSKKYSIFQIEPKSFNIEPKWDPLLEQQDQQSNSLVHEKRSRNKKYLDIFICESEGIRENMELELTAFTNFQSPTGNESTVQIKIVGNAKIPNENYTIN
ncbi:dynactin subunit p62 [Cryptosporidium sp. chipmunk genotype I]|uniref:dynactin subunit p62 n=1 Tax=Cryptosporidium sp. chipmunk genotype I TaxID=1280935 RepID=UPI003519DE3D|nr:dynactin subunit p62 [Cryptosporidium sp. chipmunk genotype I]